MPPVLDQPKKRYISQTKRITPRQQKYAELRASGLTQGAAALQAGYKNKVSASKADKHPLVRQHLSGIQKLACSRVSYTVATAMDEALQVIEFAKANGNANAFCNAVSLRAKLSGLLIDKVELVAIDLSGSIQRAEQRVLSIASKEEEREEEDAEAETGGGVGAGTPENSGGNTETRDPSGG